MKYIKTYENISNRASITVKEVKQNITLVRELQNTFTKIYDYNNITSNQTNQLQTMPTTRPEKEQYVGYIHIGENKGNGESGYFWAKNILIEVIYNFNYDFINLKYYPKAPENEQVDNFLISNLKDKVLEYDKIDRRSNKYNLCIIPIKDIPELINNLNLEEYKLFIDENKYNL